MDNIKLQALLKVIKELFGHDQSHLFSLHLTIILYFLYGFVMSSSCFFFLLQGFSLALGAPHFVISVNFSSFDSCFQYDLIMFECYIHLGMVHVAGRMPQPSRKEFDLLSLDRHLLLLFCIWI